MNIAIIEDDLQELDNLIKCLDNYFTKRNLQYNIKAFDDVESLLQYINVLDLVFLDIQLQNNQNGIDIGISIREKNKDVKIIFVTNYLEYAIEGYKAKADRYFVKPITQEHFEIEMENVIEDYLSQFAGLVDEKICKSKIYYQKILYIEFLNRKTYLHLNSGEIIKTPYTLKYWKEHLKFSSFSQPYKSILVNLNQISGFVKTDIVLTNCEKIPISKHFKKTFDQEYLLNIHKRV